MAVEREQNSECRQGNESIHAGEFLAGIYEKPGYYGYGKQHRNGGKYGDWLDCDRFYERDESEDDCNVEDVRAVRVAEREVGMSGKRRKNRYGKFRGGGSEADNDHTDHKRRYAERTRYRVGAVHKPVRAPGQQAKPGNHEKDGKPKRYIRVHGNSLLVCFGRVLYHVPPLANRYAHGTERMFEKCQSFMFSPSSLLRGRILSAMNMSATMTTAATAMHIIFVAIFRSFL